MEAGTVEAPRISGLRRGRSWAAANPVKVFLIVMGLIAVYLLFHSGLHDLAQRTINGLVSGSYFALGAIGLLARLALVRRQE